MEKTCTLWGNKRYNALAPALRRQFGGKIVKVGLDAGHSCPNRDGSLGTEGCLFCSPHGSGDFAGDARHSISEQFDTVRQRTLKKWPRARYIAYFQSYTSTYGDPDRLADLLRQTQLLPDVVGTVLSTRPDCLGDDILHVLTQEELKPLWIELGLQSVHNTSLKIMNRGHDFARFTDALEHLNARRIPVCAHIILGLPWESRDQMMETGRQVAALPLQGVKIHSLYIVKGSPLARLYDTQWERNTEHQAWCLLSRHEYVTLTADILEILPPDFLIHRLTGDGRYKDVIAPEWTLAKWELLNAIDKELENRNSWQGKSYTFSCQSSQPYPPKSSEQPSPHPGKANIEAGEGFCRRR